MSTDVRAALRAARQASRFLGRGVKRELELAIEEIEDEGRNKRINEGTQLRLMNRIKSIYDARRVERSLHVEQFLLDQLAMSPTMMLSMTLHTRVIIDNARFWRLLIAKARKENKGEGELEEWWTLAMEAFLPDWSVPHARSDGTWDNGCLPMLRHGSITLLDTSRHEAAARRAAGRARRRTSDVFPIKGLPEPPDYSLDVFDAIDRDHSLWPGCSRTATGTPTPKSTGSGARGTRGDVRQ